MKKATTFLAILLFIFANINNTLGYEITSISFQDDLVVDVEIPKTSRDMEIGLMHRTGLPEGSGMLFIFTTEQRHGIWMKNMNFPIDIIWIDGDFNIVDITEKAMPCETDACEIYTPSSPVKYVLEVPAGFAADNKVSLGQKVRLLQSGSNQ